MTDKPRILIVEDDAEIRELLTGYLGRNGFRVDTAPNAATLDRSLATYGEPDLLVLDLMLPGEDGWSICRRLRVNSAVPILILTAKGDDIDRIVGLEMGADDYLPKPFNPRELVARIRAILRRQAPSPGKAQRLRFGGFSADLEAFTLVHDGQGSIDLTSAEFALLACFLTHPGRILSRDQLMDWTRGRRSEAFDRTIDVQVSRLRKKIEAAEPHSPDGEPWLRTIRGSGYRLCVPVEES